MKLFQTIVKVFLRFLYFIPVPVIIILVVLIIGRPILRPILPESDILNFITLADWLFRWFPKIPFWYPQQGGGISFITYYPILNHLILVVITKLTSLPIAIAFRIHSLLAMILTSLGIYFLGFRLTRNQTVSFLAAFFYLLSPIAWIFLFEWGFFAEQASHLFIAPVIIFLTLFLDGLYEKKASFKTRLYGLIFLCLFVITPIAHPHTFTGLYTLIIPLIFVYPFFVYRKNIGKTLKDSSAKLIMITFIVLLLGSFWFVPFFRYRGIVKQGATMQKGEIPDDLLMQNAIYPKNFFNISPSVGTTEDIENSNYSKTFFAWRNVAFPFAISILALIGFIGSFFINKKVFSLALASLVPLTIGLIPRLALLIARIPFLGQFFSNWRSLLSTSRVIIPIVAAFGCFVVAYIIFFPLKLLIKKVKAKAINIPLKAIYLVFVTLLTFVVATFILFKFKNWPDNPSFLISYGPETLISAFKLDTRDIWREEARPCFNSGFSISDEELPPVCKNYYLHENFWLNKIIENCKGFKEDFESLPTDLRSLCKEDYSLEIVKPIVELCDGGKHPDVYQGICDARIKNLQDQISFDWGKLTEIKGERAKETWGLDRELFGLLEDKKARVDFHTVLGGFMMTEPFYSDTPELPVYYNTASLIPLMWNYEISSFYSEENVWSQPEIVDELAKYFGIKYIFLSEDITPMYKYREDSWERLEKIKTFYGLALWQFKQPTSLLEVSTKPLVLVIGERNLNAYFRIFHLGNIGGLSYDEAIFVDGGERIEDYTIDDLKQFDVVVMEGYQYKNRSKAWKLLENYLEGGGSLYFNTGWQYSSADWELESTPDFFPLKSLEWISLDNSSNYKLNEGLMGFEKDIDVDDFSPLVVGGQSWGVSSGNNSSLRDWAKPILSVDQQLLVAGGSYDSGRVLWTGFDIPGHIGAFQENPEEIKFFHKIMKYLLDGKEGKIINSDFNRSYPDKVEIDIENGTNQKTVVYWKEAYYPDFKATLVTRDKRQETRLKSYKAGPGMTAFILPSVKAGTKIVYEYKTPFSIIFARIISLTTFVLMIIVIVSPRLFNRVTNFLSRKSKKLSRGVIGDAHDEDIHY